MVKVKDIMFDLWDIDLSRKQMEEYGDCDMPFFGRNEADEPTMTSVFKDKIIMLTYQDNGWLRTNILYRDGECEELYERTNRDDYLSE